MSTPYGCKMRWACLPTWIVYDRIHKNKDNGWLIVFVRNDTLLTRGSKQCKYVYTSLQVNSRGNHSQVGISLPVGDFMKKVIHIWRCHKYYVTLLESHIQIGTFDVIFVFETRWQVTFYSDLSPSVKYKKHIKSHYLYVTLLESRTQVVT